MKSFDDYKWREGQLACFNEWADFEGLDLRMSGEFEHSNKETHMTYLGFRAGQQSKQAEVDELKKRVDEAIYDLQHIESAMWEEQVEHVLMILKGDQS